MSKFSKDPTFGGWAEMVVYGDMVIPVCKMCSALVKDVQEHYNVMHPMIAQWRYDKEQREKAFGAE